MTWLAGPITGLIGQPWIGAISDAQSGAFRRRKFIVLSALWLSVFGLCAAYSHYIAFHLVMIFGHVQGDWDPSLSSKADRVARWIAVAAFWMLDLSLNTLQATSRALVLDTVPSGQQATANAWQARLSTVGNICGI